MRGAQNSLVAGLNKIEFHLGREEGHTDLVDGDRIDEGHGGHPQLLLLEGLRVVVAGHCLSAGDGQMVGAVST